MLIPLHGFALHDRCIAIRRVHSSSHRETKLLSPVRNSSWYLTSIQSLGQRGLYFFLSLHLSEHLLTFILILSITTTSHLHSLVNHSSCEKLPPLFALRC